MAIKIKKKDGSKAEEELDVAIDGEEAELDGAEKRAEMAAASYDPFERRTMETANWVENNRGLVIGGILAAVAVLIGGYYYFQQQDEKAIGVSASLDSVFTEYAVPIEGSPELEQLKSNPQLPQPKKTFKTNDEKWQAIYDSAAKSLSEHPTGPISKSARLAKSAGALGLKKYDEAITLYEAHLADGPDDSTKAPALQGLATAYIGAGKSDKAIETLKKLEEMSEQYKPSAKYQQAVLLETSGKVDEAKSLYHQILETDPTFSKKTDIERRLATL